MKTPRAPANPDIDPVRAIAPHLHAPEDLIRCAAARALGALGDESAAPALAGALMDEDPDVRSDSMAALVHRARPQDAAAIRRSLQSDPVGEVKTAAIQALCRLEDEASIALLRALAKDRCETEVAWEDGSWDDWLDVQVAAIDALGRMNAGGAVDDLIEARSDESGQDLDHAVFAGLARMPGRGVATLLGFLGDGDARVRQRALAALSNAGCDLLAPVRDNLVHDPSPSVRQLAIDCFDDDTALSALALKDPAASVRRAALARIALARPDMARLALSDPDEDVRAIALEAMAPVAEPALAADVKAWLRTADSRLAVACAAVLPGLAGVEALDALRDAASDGERPPEVRIAALRSLGEIGTEEAAAVLRSAAVDPARQVRLAAFAALAVLARTAPDPLGGRAREVLTDAARGDLRVEQSAQTTTGIGDISTPGASPTEQSGAGPIAITPEGDIVPADTRVPGALGGAEDGPYPRSTLEAIQARSVQVTGAPVALDDAARSSERHKRVGRRRVPVDGTDDIAADVRRMALRMAADCAGDGIDESLAEAAESATPDIAVAAFEAIARRAAAMPLAPGLVALLIRSLERDDPLVRAAAARALANATDAAARHLAPLLDDPDPAVRTVAMAVVAPIHPEKVTAGFRDPSPLVRRATVDALVPGGDRAVLEKGLRMFVEGGRTDSLADACRRYAEARQVLIGMLGAPELSRQTILTILEALACAADPD